MGLFLLPSGMFTRADDGLFAEWHENMMLDVADLSAFLGLKYPHPAFAATTWGLRGYVKLDSVFFDSKFTPTAPYTDGGVRYYPTNG